MFEKSYYVKVTCENYCHVNTTQVFIFPHHDHRKNVCSRPYTKHINICFYEALGNILFENLCFSYEFVVRILERKCCAEVNLIPVGPRLYEYETMKLLTKTTFFSSLLRLICDASIGLSINLVL